MSNAIFWPKLLLTVMSRLKAPEYGPPLHLHGCQIDMEYADTFHIPQTTEAVKLPQMSNKKREMLSKLCELTIRHLREIDRRRHTMTVKMAHVRYGVGVE